MEQLKSKRDTLTHDISEYAETYFKLTVLKATDKAASFASVSVAAVLLVVLSFFFLLFLSLGLGWWLGQVFDNMIAGFCIIAGFYLLLVVLILALRKNVILPMVKNFVIRTAYE